MKVQTFISLIVFLSCAATACAKKREWQSATVLDAKTGTAGSVAVGTVSGNSYGASGLAIAARIPVIYYWIGTGKMVYVVECAVRGTLRYRCPDITVHGKTKVAIEGRDAHILDDQGKDRKLPIIEKVPQEDEKAAH